MTILGHCELIKRGACLLVCAALAACAGQALEARGPLPKVEPGQIPFSSYEPEQPFRVAENGVSSRSTFAAPVLPGFRVEVRDLIVAPVEKPIFFRRRWKNLVFDQSFFSSFSPSGESSKVNAAWHVATTDGGCDVEKRNGRPRW